MTVNINVNSIFFTEHLLNVLPTTCGECLLSVPGWSRGFRVYPSADMNLVWVYL